MKTYTLHELNEYIRRILALNLPEAIWVSCEIAQLNASRGHYYLELVEKGAIGEMRSEEREARNGDVIAHSTAVIWQSAYRQLRRKLGFDLDSLLRSGLAVRVKVRPDFHERFGLKLIIEDIDPSYTLGQLELQRQQTIQTLKQKGLLELNQQLHLPPVIQHIAVITSEKAAGYQDFLDQIHQNTYGYRFFPKLFPSSMQGQQVEPEMIKQLKKINKQAKQVDCVVIIRGGGSRLDLEAFDRLALSSAVAQAKVPIITGIGHEVDQSVLDLVAHSSLKTPTAVADFIINRNMLFETRVLELGMRIQQDGKAIVRSAELQIERMEQQLEFAVKNKTRIDHTQLESIQKEIPVLTRHLLEKSKMKLAELEKMKELLSPGRVLQRGYSLTLKGDKIVKSVADLSAGDEIRTRLGDGEAASTIK